MILISLIQEFWGNTIVEINDAHLLQTLHFLMLLFGQGNEKIVLLL